MRDDATSSFVCNALHKDSIIPIQAKPSQRSRCNKQTKRVGFRCGIASTVPANQPAPCSTMSNPSTVESEQKNSTLNNKQTHKIGGFHSQREIFQIQFAISMPQSQLQLFSHHFAHSLIRSLAS